MSWFRDLFSPAPRPALPDFSGGPELPPAPEQRADSIRNSATSFGMPTDRGQAGRPDTTRKGLTRSELTALWRYNGYGRRIVAELPAEATRKGWQVQGEDEQPVEGVEQEFNRLRVRQHLQMADTWGRLYGTALILLVTDEGEEEPEDMDLSQPLDPSKVKAVVNLVVLDRHEFQVGTLTTSPMDPNFGRPENYYVTPSGAATSSTLVHHTRVLRFDGAELPPTIERSNEGTAASILDLSWDQARTRTVLDQAVAVQAQQMSIDVVTTPALSAQATGDGAANFWTRMKQIALGKSSQNLLLLASGEEYEQKTSNPTGFKDLDTMTRNSLQAVTGYPASRLFGQAPGGLSSDDASGERLWHQVIAAYQGLKYEPGLRRLLEVLVLASDSGIDGDPDDMAIVFNPLGEPTQKELAETRKVVADTDVAYINAGVLAPDVVGASRFRPTGYSAETEEWDQAAWDRDEADALRREMEAQEREAARLAAESGPDNAEPGEDPAEGADDEESPAEELDTEDPARREDAILVDPVKVVVWVAYTGEALSTLEALREGAEGIVGPMTPSEPLHTTVLYLGDVERAALPTVEAVVAGVASRMETPPPNRCRRIALFPSGDKGTPVVVEHSGAWGVEVAYDRLLRALAHLVSKPQHPDYRIHSTLGYVEGFAPTPEQTAALYALVASKDGEYPMLHWSHLTVRVTEADGTFSEETFKAG